MTDLSLEKKPGVEVIYLAGGCFWGLQKLMQSLPGVVNTVSGYANGTSDKNPTYRAVCSGTTGFRETVRVEYDPRRTSLDTLLYAYFAVIDPTVKNAQGNDKGTQYQTGIYYTDEASGRTIAQIVAIQRERHPQFAVETKPLECFYDAEEYHQNYLDKNPSGYCHIPPKEMEKISQIVIDPAEYKRPAKDVIAQKLNDMQFDVTQNAATEPPFQNAFWDHFEKGIYVDLVTGEPLFSSQDKYLSSCGWPSFAKGLDDNTLVYLEDRSLFMKRTEVRSRTGNSHLGHVFRRDPESPTKTRYCINSASLRFIPYDEMESQGYGYLKRYVEEKSQK